MKRIFILSLFILYVQSKDSIFQHSKDVVHSILHRDHFLKVEESKPIHYDFEKPVSSIRVIIPKPDFILYFYVYSSF